MAGFEADSVRVVESRSLRASGARWTEVNFLFAYACGCLCGAGLFVAAVCFGIGWLASANGAMMAGCIVAAASLCLWTDAEYPRAIIFHDNGRIEIPQGLPYRSKDRWIEGDHRYITNIQLDQGQPLGHLDASQCFEVSLYCANGDIITVAEQLTKREAHKLSVLLTTALTSMRTHLSEMPGKRASAQPAQGGPAPAFID